MPDWVRAILAALRVRNASPGHLQRLDDRQWEEALAFCDRQGLTLLLGSAPLPDWVRERVARDLAHNGQRLQRARAAFTEIHGALAAGHVEFLALKGFTQWPEFIADPALRAQYDIDIYCHGDDVFRARDILAARGYEPVAALEDFPTDHLPVMVRKTGWEWRGDYFDPEIPFSVELHFRFWDDETERIVVPGLEQFWPRRVSRSLWGETVSVLHPADALGYTALHLVRHLLRGNLRAYHVFELAWFLESHHDDDAFWAECRALEPEAMRRLEAIAFKLASIWFGCRVREEAACLPEGTAEWFERYANSPLEGQFRPNKDELWLHLALVEPAAGRRAVLRRRLLPLRMPGPIDSVYVARMTRWQRIRSRFRYVVFLGGRIGFHLRVLPRLACHGVAACMPSAYWRFLFAASLFNLGMFVFVVLYNLLLLDRGFGERVIGFIVGMATAGSVAATLPAAGLAHRFGLRAVLTACFVWVAGMSALRVVLTDQAALAIWAAAAGGGLAVWAVSLPPAVSQLTGEKRRAFGFSLFIAFSIALGAVGGWLAGRMAGWIGKEPALLGACALMLAAALPAVRLPLGPAPQASRVFPRGGFILRFLAALAVWNFAVGSFNPFFNIYFAHRFQLPAENIGLLFSAVQLAQVGPLLLAPWLFRRMGLANGIAATLGATGVALAALAAPGGVAAASLAYGAYMISQSMAEPGMYTLLMGGVQPSERGGASALHFLMAFGVQALAAAIAGAGFSRFGYVPVLAAAAVAAAIAALLFRGLLSRFLPSAGNPPR